MGYLSLGVIIFLAGCIVSACVLLYFALVEIKDTLLDIYKLLKERL